jgi:hypothetical protein
MAVPNCRQNSVFSDSSEKWSFVGSFVVGQQKGTMQALILQVSDFSPKTYRL